MKTNTKIEIEAIEGGYIALVKDRKTGKTKEFVFKGTALNEWVALSLRIKWAVISKQIKEIAGVLWVGFRVLLGFIFAGLGFFALMCDLADDNAWRLFVVLKIIALPLLSISFWLFTGASVKQAINDTRKFFCDMYRDIKGLFS